MRESSGVAPGLSALPQGGGGVAPLGDRFQPDFVRGSGSYAIPLRLPQGPNELRPSLSLAYATGAGNGPFGLGWRLNTLRIERRTDRGLPLYDDDEDTFAIGGAEILVPVGGARYRAQTETRFWHIQRLAQGWRVRTGDGRTLFFGRSDESREMHDGRVFAWALDEEQDAAGNSIHYRYLRDGNRLYLQEVAYSIFRLELAYEPRPDVLRDGRAGFLRHTRLRATALALHCARLDPTLMRTYTLRYEQAANGLSLLAGVRLAAERDGQEAAMPELTLTYAPARFDNWRVHSPQAMIPPPDLNDPDTQLVDLTGDGLPDILQSAGSRMYLWRNRGDARFEGPSSLDGVPSTMQLSRQNVAFADLNGNGRVDLFAVDQPLQLAFESDGRGGFRSDPVVFSRRPTLGLAAGDSRLMDVDGDGVIDLISTERRHLLLYRHEPGAGWQDPLPVPRNRDLAQFPDLSFDERGVRLGDMTGDGLRDFVLLRSGDASYWPYLGHGRWAARVTMANAPVLPAGYREEHLYLLDMDGDGCMDVVYVDYDRILIWLNRAGNGFAPPVAVPVAPVTGARRLHPADYFGDGRLSLGWSASAVETGYGAGMRVLRFDAGRHPYLLTTVDNGMGGRFEIDYSSTTTMRLQDAAEGRDWPGILPLVVPVVQRIRQVDAVSGRVQDMQIRYHDGVYDGPNREFRGFRAATVDSDGDDSIPASRQEMTFFQGDPEHPDLVERARQRALAGTPLTSATFEHFQGAWRVRQSSNHTWHARLEHDAGPRSVFFPHVAEIEAREHSPTGGPDRVERTRMLDYDAHGNLGRRLRESFAPGGTPVAPPESLIRAEENFTYTNNEAAWLVKLPVRLELRDGDGVPFAARITTYDGAPFSGLPEGQVTAGLPTRLLELKLLATKLPADYSAGRDFTALGYIAAGVGDTAGFYAPVAAYRRDARGNVVEQQDAGGAALQIFYDADGVYPQRTLDPLGRETTLEFEPLAGEPRSVQMPDGRRLRYQYDPLGRLVAQFETDDDGDEQLVKAWATELAATPAAVTSVAPNAPGRQAQEFAPGTDFAALDGVSVSRQYYDGFGNEALRISRAADGPTGERRFVAHPRSLLNPRGLTRLLLPAEFRPDLAFFAPPAGAPAGSARTRYDGLGQVTATAGPGPVHHRAVRDVFTIEHYEGAAAGDFAGGPPPGPPSREETFDSRGRLVRIDEARGDGHMVTTRYDLTLDGRIAAVRDGAGAESARFTFAGPGEAIRIVQRDAGERSYYRNAAGQLVELVKASGSRLFYEYDALQRLRRIRHSPAAGEPATLVRELSYDQDPQQPGAGRFLDGRVALARELDVEVRYSYNRGGQATREETTAGGVTLAVAREYDFQGRLAAVVYPDGARHPVTHDESGSVTGVPGLVSHVAYDPYGTVMGYTLGNGVEVRATQDAASRRLQTLSATQGGTLGGAVLRQLTYGYNATGDITGLTDEQPGQATQHLYGYDGLHRLTHFETHAAGGPLLQQGDYVYDDGGNLQQLPEVQPLELAYADAAHPGRVTALDHGAGPTPVTYDGLGNVASIGPLATLEYDALDRLGRVLRDDGTEIRYTYDHQGRMVTKTVIPPGGGSQTVRYAGGMFEQHAAHALRHLFFGRRLVATERVAQGVPDARVYIFSDHHGTILMTMDAAGVVIQQQRYSPFGLPLNNAVDLDRYLGRERDGDTGLLHLGARMYLPAIGRFISPDWYILENPDRAVRMPQGYNVYAYALNNPLVFKDPSGLWFGLDDVLVLAIGFTVGFFAGLIYGLANGQGWGSFLTALETGLTTAAGAWLGWTILGPVGAVMGGMNGLVSGINGIYDWTSVDGWFAFISDSTWSLIGTSLGNVVHIINLFYDDANYRSDLSRRQNRHVYEGGFALKEDFAFTQGNVISNAGLGQGAAGIDPAFIADHEELHIWQQRFFGPIFQLTYVVWGVGGFIVGSVVWFFSADEDWWSLVETAAYYDNPFEYWAYKNDSNWPPSGANPTLTW